MSVIQPPVTDANAAVDVGETRAKGARNVGLIWMLITSTIGAVLALGVVWALFSGQFSATGNAGVSNHKPPPQARSTPAGA